MRVDFVPARRYPLGRATAHLLGYVGEVTESKLLLEEFVTAAAGDIVGQTGIERVYNPLLTGSDGYFDRVVDARQRVLVEGGLRHSEPVRGHTVELRVSGALQEAAMAAFGDRSGAFVALDVRTGEVLGLASYPAYDPGEFLGDADAFRALRSDPRRPLLNRAVQGRYPPGLVLQAGDRRRRARRGRRGRKHAVPLQRTGAGGGRTFRCHRESGHGSLSLREAIAESCNVYFYRLAETLDVDVIAEYARVFGLGARTGVDLLNEVPGLVPTAGVETPGHRRAVGYASETASVAVGQGPLQVTPIQMARLVAAFASSGELHVPRLAAAVPSARVPAVSAEHFELIRSGMRDAVLGGTAWRARIPGFETRRQDRNRAGGERLAGGAGQRGPGLRAPHPCVVVGFAPFDEPEIAVAVVVEHGGAGGAAAAPIGREIMAAWRVTEPAADGSLPE